MNQVVIKTENDTGWGQPGIRGDLDVKDAM